MSRFKCFHAAAGVIAVGIIVGALSGCGGRDTPGSTTPTGPVDTKPAAASAPPRTSSADRQDGINEIVSDYLSEIIDVPSSVRDPATATAATNKLASEVGDHSVTCKTAVRKVSEIIDRSDLSGAAKRKRVLDAMLPVYGDC